MAYKEPNPVAPAPRPTVQEQLDEIRRLEEEQELHEGLPHIFGYKWYPWAREFFESTNNLNFLCAGNQISKSSTQIRKCIEWATNTNLWPELWPGKKPNLFWYLYPSQKVVDAEFKTKWQEFLPRGKFKDHPKYGWKAVKDGSHIIGIQFNSGILLNFKTYSQKEEDLQSGTVYALFCDEELPVRHYQELMFRISATDGYFHMVFTATLGQDFWRQVLEPDDDEPELLPDAWKKQVSLFEAMNYEDGTPSHWTNEKIQIVMNRCPTHDEVMRRVYGKFVVPLAGRKYPSFNSKTCFIKPHKLPHDWEIIAGVDPGGGGDSHPAGIAFLAVDPTYTQGRIFAGWRGDDVGNTTAGDVFERYLAMKNDLRVVPARKFYDQACKDFKTISDRVGEGFEPAEKSHDVGDEILNLLFKHGMLKIFDDDPELQKLGRELSTIKKSTPKGKRKDDLTDAARYSITKVIWNLDRLSKPTLESLPEVKEETYDEQCLRERRERAKGTPKTPEEEQQEYIEAEFEELNAMYEGY